MDHPRQHIRKRLRDGLVFFHGFLRRPGAVRSVSQSSRHMVNRILHNAGALNGGLVLEFGAGLGRVTERLLEQMGPEGRLLSFETHPQYAQHLRDSLRDPRLEVVEDAADRAPHHLKKRQLAKATHIVSTAPLRKETGAATAAAAADCLAPGGHYVQIGLWCGKDVFRPHFQYVKQELVVRNCPPEIIHVLRRPDDTPPA